MNDWFHKRILEKMPPLCDWFDEQVKGQYVPFYSSYDVRDASFKATNVDANIYPAGFNNICPTDKEQAPELAQKYISRHYPAAKKILLITEDHLKNIYYWENVAAIKDLLDAAGFEVRVGMPGLQNQDEITLEGYLGSQVKAEKVVNGDGTLQVKGFTPDVIISNNDFSKIYGHWIDLSKAMMTPSMELGWYRRQKSVYFECYNEVAGEFARLLDADPWFFQVRTELFNEFDAGSEQSRGRLADKIDAMIENIRADYAKNKIDETPFVFVKNNSGTYGLGVVKATSGQDVRSWNYDSKKKMKAQKGGGRFDEVIIQEGVPTIVKSDRATAEPTIYMIGSALAGGFLRAHENKDETDSLNSPGAVYKKLCLSDLKIKAEGCPLENVYGWIGKMGLLAIGRETEKLGIKYHGYQK